MHETSRLSVCVIAHDLASDQIATVHYAQRSWTPQPAWTIPGGKVDPGEEIHLAAARELYEECGLIAASESLRLVHTLQARQGWDGKGGFVLFAFAVTEFSGRLANMEPDKHLDVRWSPATRLPAPMFPTSRRAVEVHLRGGPAFSTFGWDAATLRDMEEV
ncbi:NUDIX domain-containing protein [Kitasatospora camelliae]|uniref:NUDIX domain-containing protein n=1 Tax=Kitasatospora camelliae TaxID=3156397 RepID=A0AAU8JU92_9ACTN